MAKLALYKMGLGPWYRLGMTLGNALLLTAIIETVNVTIKL